MSYFPQCMECFRHEQELINQIEKEHPEFRYHSMNDALCDEFVPVLQKELSVMRDSSSYHCEKCSNIKPKLKPDMRSGKVVKGILDSLGKEVINIFHFHTTSKILDFSNERLAPMDNVIDINFRIKYLTIFMTDFCDNFPVLSSDNINKIIEISKKYKEIRFLKIKPTLLDLSGGIEISITERNMSFRLGYVSDWRRDEWSIRIDGCFEVHN